MSDLTEDEIEVLRMLNGDIPGQWGAWVAAGCESLKEMGYARGLYEITDKGKAHLAAVKGHNNE